MVSITKLVTNTKTFGNFWLERSYYHFEGECGKIRDLNQLFIIFWRQKINLNLIPHFSGNFKVKYEFHHLVQTNHLRRQCLTCILNPGLRYLPPGSCLQGRTQVLLEPSSEATSRDSSLRGSQHFLGRAWGMFFIGNRWFAFTGSELPLSLYFVDYQCITMLNPC